MSSKSLREKDICLDLTHSDALSIPAVPADQLESSCDHSCLHATCRVSDSGGPGWSQASVAEKAPQVVPTWYMG